MAKRHNMLLSLMTMLLTNCIFAQNVIVNGEFPQPSTVALYKPVIASSTCGTETENYCQYNTNAAASLSPNCISATCNNTCPFSNSSPAPKELSEVGSLGPGVSVVSETGPGQTDVLQFIDSFVTIASSSASQISENGFTFAAWIKQDEGNTG